jgi:hypothetical protein
MEDVMDCAARSRAKFIMAAVQSQNQQLAWLLLGGATNRLPGLAFGELHFRQLGLVVWRWGKFPER